MNPNEKIPGLIDMARVPAYYAPAYNQQDEGAEDSKVPLSQYLWILKRYRWRIGTFVLACVLGTLFISIRLTPIYESVATVDVDRQEPVGVVGQDATRTNANDADQFLATQIKLVQSDSVLRPVDKQFHLRQQEKQSEAGSARGEQSPVTLKQLKVTRPPNTYLIQISYRSADPQLAADAANSIAQSYLEHAYTIRLRSAAGVASFMERQLEELRAKMERSSQALLAFEREMNVINPEEKTNILAARLLQLNTEYTTAQADRLKKQASYDSVKSGSLEAALATAQGEQLRKLGEHRNEALEQFSEVKSFFGANHPEYRKAQAKLSEIDQAFENSRTDVARRVQIEFEESQQRESMALEAVGEAKREFDKVNARSFEYGALKREAEADKNLYEELVRKIKEAGINAGFQNGAIRIADPARPTYKPVFPNVQLNVLLALLFSSLVAIGGAVLTDLLDKTIRDPEQVMRTLGTEVIGSLPLLKRTNKNIRQAEGSKAGGKTKDEADFSGFHESVRTLRNSILLANFDRQYRSLLVTSASPGEGKTTTAANLASAHAEQGKATLLIDGDLRRPSVHRNFDIPSIVGLSNVLMGEIAWREALVRIDDVPNLSVLPAGPPSRRAADLVGTGLSQLLEEAASEFDLVVLDAPPLLGFAEPLQMATAVDGVLVVARAGQTSRRAVANVLGTLTRLRAKIVGIVLNEVHKELSDSYYYYGYYRSYYHPLEDSSKKVDKKPADEKVRS